MSYGSRFDQEEVLQTYTILCKINEYFQLQMPDVEAFLYHLECQANIRGMDGSTPTYLRVFGYVMTPYRFVGDPTDVRYKISVDTSILYDFLTEK